jgi:hypothetical protein
MTKDTNKLPSLLKTKPTPETMKQPRAEDPARRRRPAQRRVLPDWVLAGVLAGVIIGGTAWGATGPMPPDWPLSVHAFYQPQDRVFEPGLVGKWRGADEHDRSGLQFEAQGTNGYKLTFKLDLDRDETEVMEVCAFRLQGQLFLDLRSAPDEKTREQLLAPPLIPSHLLLRVDQCQPTLRAKVWNEEWVQGYLKKQPDLLQGEILGDPDDRIVLTAKTARLRQLVLQSLTMTNAWEPRYEIEYRKEPLRASKPEAAPAAAGPSK